MQNGTPVTAKDVGARHAGEIEYVFGMLDTIKNVTWAPEDRALSNAMMEYWSSFAKTGTPKASGAAGVAGLRQGGRPGDGPRRQGARRAGNASRSLRGVRRLREDRGDDAARAGPGPAQPAVARPPTPDVAAAASGAPAVLRTFTFTLLALVAFASNSLLARFSLGTGAIDAATFTAIRLLAGAAVLVALVRIRDGAWTALRGGGPLGPIALFVYAVPFSLAYVRIGAAVGALVLFGVVQLTMVGYGLASGERPSLRTWAGLGLAASGLVV